MNNISQRFLTEDQAKAINQSISFGCPTEDRLLIFTPNEETKTNSGIIIPKTDKDTVPKKGVVIQMGSISEDYKSYKYLLKIGSIVTYGIYAGKEIDFNINAFSIDVKNILETNEGKFSVLSLNEVIYVENNVIGITNNG